MRAMREIVEDPVEELVILTVVRSLSLSGVSFVHQSAASVPLPTARIAQRGSDGFTAERRQWVKHREMATPWDVEVEKVRPALETVNVGCGIPT